MKRSVIIQVLMIVVLFVFIGCESQINPTVSEVTPETQTSLAKKSGYPAYAGESFNGVYILWARRNIEVGEVTIEDGIITISSNDSQVLHNVEVNIWNDLTDVPDYRPEPGHAQFDFNNLDSEEVELDFSSYDFSYISIRVVMSNAPVAYVGGTVYPQGFPKTQGPWWGFIAVYVEPAPT